MASIRQSKKVVSYLIGEVISNSYLAIYFHEESKDQLLDVIAQAIELHDTVVYKLNHPAEKKNPSLVRKHYRLTNQELINGVDELFVKISEICQK
ncbi:MAG: hypothetical protein R3Y19_04305 [Rikenellaceae bacterium]